MPCVASTIFEGLLASAALISVVGDVSNVGDWIGYR